MTPVSKAAAALMDIPQDLKLLQKRVTFQGLNILIDHLREEPFSIESSPELGSDRQG